ncbi:MAG: hypothetical protein ACYTHK_03635 [Planctomycetota bacterium]
MKKISALLLSAFLVACGGGGGGDSNNNGGDIPDNPILQAAEQLLNDCAGVPVEALLDVIETIRVFPGQATPPIQIAAPEPGGIPFTADPGAGAPIPTLTGRITFEDAGGVSFMPFTQQDLMNDLNNLLTGIAGLPDGTVVSIIIDPVPEQGIETALLTQVMQGGLPTDVSGSMVHDSGSCRSTFSFDGETILGLLGAYPNIDATIEITQGTDSLVGTAFFNGTANAVIEITLNGTGPFQFDFDLDTGEITSSN